MKIAVSVEGLVVPHVIKIGKVEKGFCMDDEEDNYSFLVRLSGASIDRIFAATKKEAEEKRKNLIADINRFYGEPLDI